MSISNPADLSVGSHAKTFAIGTVVDLLGAGSTEMAEDYFIVIKADPNCVVTES